MNDHDTPRLGARRGPISRLLDAIGSVPFGVTMMVLILLWCWIGSAGTAPFGRWFVRQSFEKTEMEWFNWWPFHLLLILLALALVLVTVRKIRLNVPNLGVWTIHTGVIVLLAGGWIYFGTKLEGDVAVYRRAAVLQAGGETTRLVLAPGNTATVPTDDGLYAISVVALDPNYELLTGDDKGKRAYAAQLMIVPPAARAGARPFIRQLLDGFPQYTEDVLPGEGRAIKVIGRALVDERLVAELDYAAADRLHLNDRPALHARVAGTEAWHEFSLPGLPRYAEHLADPRDAFFRPGHPQPRSRALDLRARDKGGAPLPGELSFRVTGYLPAAWIEETLEAGGEEIRPFLGLSTEASGVRGEHLLVAGDPGRDRVTLENGAVISFTWTSRPASPGAPEESGEPMLVVRVPERGVERRLPVADLLEREIAIDGTPYRVAMQRWMPRWVLAGSGETASMALVEIQSAGGPFLRAVMHPQVERSRDFDAGGSMLDELVDSGIELSLENVRPPGVTIQGSPAGLAAISVSEDGSVVTVPLAIDQEIELAGGSLRLTPREVAERARAVEQPIVIPPEERDARAGPSFALVRVEAEHAGQTRSMWVRYSHYTHPGRVGFHPRVLAFDGLPPVEVLFSRETLQLPQPVALEAFHLETFPGGTREREYTSQIRFRENGTWSEPRTIQTNNPTGQGGWWFFQSTWDPPDPSSGYAGLNYTGLGVGNRHGVGVLLLGGIMTVLGTAWAFYVKPVILRRRLRRRGGRTSGETSAPAMVALLLLGAGLIGATQPLPAHARDWTLSVDPAFAAALDLSRIRRTAVQDEGRIKTFDSLAREKLRLVDARGLRDTDPVLLYLDLVLAPEHYGEERLIRIPKPAFRRQLVQAVRGLVPPEQRTGAVGSEELARIERDGRVSSLFLSHPAVRAAMSILERDLMRTGKEVQKLHAAWAYADGGVLASAWRPVPIAGDHSVPWLSIQQAISADSPHAATLDPRTGEALAGAWTDLASAWSAGDAVAAGAALDSLGAAFASAAPEIYPSPARLSWEHWYYRNDKLTRVWLLYFLALPPLLMAVVYRFRWARIAGLSIFGLAFMLHTLSIVVRWWLAGRIPNANMFEAIVASAWFGGLTALVLEIILRRWPLKNLPALAASVYAMLVLMAGHFIPVWLPHSLNSDIGTVMPVLDRTVWLYIHTNIVIASYALIFFGSVTALLYLALRAAVRLAPTPRLVGLWAGPGGAAPPRGGASSIILSRRGPAGASESAGLARSLDGATMIFLELAFISLWVGTILGAVWADVSWGRPWGWDPKEVFALNTWLVFLVLVHVRLRVKDKGLWTALLAVAGCAVMLFNWIAVNFVIVGLHSYA